VTESVHVRIDRTHPPTIDLSAVCRGEFAATVDWLSEHRRAIDAALTEHGALYFAHAGIRDRADFAALRDILFDRLAAYREKATPRTDFGADVFSSTDLPPAQEIRQHNENSYTLVFPGKLLFGCLTAPESGGATTVADVRSVLTALPIPIVDRMAEAGWRLTRNYHELVGLPWRTAFGTERRSDVEDYCTANAVDCSWTHDSLHTEQVRPGIIRHPCTDQPVWFNHASFWSEWALEPEIREVLVTEFGRSGLPFATSYGDGADLIEAEVADINTAYDRATRRRPWARGDLLLVDNLLSSHGRDPFVGARDIVVAMGEPVALADCAPLGPTVVTR
jgi:alpha-ketoglutarate-dependent taurine dioxygenase